jgi:hypothetical protein
VDLKWDSASERPRIGARIGMRIGGVFEEDADVDDHGGADADLCESR